MFSKWSDKLAAFVKALAPRKAGEVVKAGALTLVIAIGVSMAVVGSSPAPAQSSGMCAMWYSGAVCARGSVCLFGGCWDWASYYPRADEGCEMSDTGQMYRCDGGDWEIILMT